MELDLEHLAGYLPYELEGKYQLKNVIIDSKSEEVRDKRLTTDNVDFFIMYCKPLLRPVSSLDTQKLINDLHGNLPDNVFDWIDSSNLNSVDKNEAILCAPFPVIQWCYKNHIDIHGLIDKGLAIAIED